MSNKSFLITTWHKLKYIIYIRRWWPNEGFLVINTIVVNSDIYKIRFVLVFMIYYFPCPTICNEMLWNVRSFLFPFIRSWSKYKKIIKKIQIIYIYTFTKDRMSFKCEALCRTSRHADRVSCMMCRYLHFCIWFKKINCGSFRLKFAIRQNVVVDLKCDKMGDKMSWNVRLLFFSVYPAVVIFCPLVTNIC